MPTDGNQLVAQVVTVADFDALREIANQLTGLLWQRQRAADDPDEVAGLQAERLAVRSQLRAILPGTPAVDAALQEWGARLRALRA